MDNEERLGGGNATHRVTRAGATVRKPWTEASPSVAAYMTALRLAGIDVPEHLGQDEQGRQVLEFIPGRLAMHSESLTPNELGRVGALVRAIHDVSATYRPAVDAVWQTAWPCTTCSNPHIAQARSRGRPCSRRGTATTGVQ